MRYGSSSVLIGATDEIGRRATGVVHPIKDFHVTLLRLMGLDDIILTVADSSSSRKPEAKSAVFFVGCGLSSRHSKGCGSVCLCTARSSARTQRG